MTHKDDVRLIIPVLGQDVSTAAWLPERYRQRSETDTHTWRAQFGSANNNWVGNFVDLVRYRKNPSWDYMQAKKNVDFYTGESLLPYRHRCSADRANRHHGSAQTAK